MATTTETSKSTKSDSKPTKVGTPAPVSAPKDVAGHTLADLASAYLAALEAKGTSIMTRASYAADLAVALKALGEKTRVSTLTARKVQNFFESDTVMKTKTGRPLCS